MNKKEIIELLDKTLNSNDKELSHENRKILLNIKEKINRRITKKELFSYLTETLKVISSFSDWFKDT